MRRLHLVALLGVAALVCACGGTDGGRAGRAQQAAARAQVGADRQSPGAEAAPAEQEPSDVATGTDRPLGEFEPLTSADADMYLAVMRTAATRVRGMPAADRRALKLMRQMTSGGGPARGQLPSAEQMAAIQRAGELMSLDAGVAREQGVSKRFSSVQNRVDRFLRPMTGSSGDEHEEMTAEHRAWLLDRIRKFKVLDGQDAAVLAPHRAELLALERQVRLALHPESMPE